MTTFELVIRIVASAIGLGFVGTLLFLMLKVRRLNRLVVRDDRVVVAAIVVTAVITLLFVASMLAPAWGFGPWWLPVATAGVSIALSSALAGWAWWRHRRRIGSAPVR